jgi:hypothetical protein
MSQYLFNLPLEEVLFFVVIPFCCIFSWKALHERADERLRSKAGPG